MPPAASPPASRFDRVVRLTLLGLAAAAALLAWRGSRPAAAAAPAVLYLAWDAGRGSTQLYAVPLSGGAPTQLTDEPYRVDDFAAAPDGQTIAYSVRRADGGSDLWAVNRDGSGRRQLLACANAACNQPAWAPDGQRLLYERRGFDTQTGTVGAARLWWLDLRSAQTTPLIVDSQALGYRPTFAPAGGWINYVAPLEAEIRVVAADGQTRLRLPSQTGEPAAFSPDGRRILLTQLAEDAAAYTTVILAADVPTGTVQSLTGTPPAVDAWPTYAPDGRQIAFTRRIPGETAGSQLWLMQPDGSEQRALTADADLHHGRPAWSPDGRFLVFLRRDMVQGTDPAIWLLDVTTGAARELAPAGTQPAFLPASARK